MPIDPIKPAGKPTGRERFLHDAFLIITMGMLAACGLIYEYLMAHYAGRVLGALESTIYTMIGIMIVAMGVGAFLAKWIRAPFTSFVWLEVAIGFVGASAVIVISVSVSLTFSLPTYLQEIYGLHPSITTDGGVVRGLSSAVRVMPFIAGAILGLMIGMEIPLIARIREHLHRKHLEHNIGIIYGADYIGAGIGAAIWVLICLKLPIVVAALSTALVNALVGVAFLIRYRAYLTGRIKLWIAHGLLLLLITVLALGGASWMDNMQSALFKDQVVYTKITPYQHLTITNRLIGKGLPKITSLYINGRLQFSSNDEVIYHSFLTYPALLASARQEHILVIGGGDGLALRDILRWNPTSVTLIDLDPGMVNLFAGKDPSVPRPVNRTLLKLNENSLNDARVKLIYGDAFIEVEKLVSSNRHFDTIIVDLPDPSHPDINKVYSEFFYARLKELLSADGAIAIQSTSPFHTRDAFISIGKTLKAAGFNTEQYHTNVPTFGEWGWTIGTVMGGSASARIAHVESLPVPSQWLSKQQMLAAFVFAPNYFNNAAEIKSNPLGSHQLYQYHQNAWKKQDGVFFIDQTSHGSKP
ncbi:MAG: polyamine aminopropyltransferase [Pseudomonadales bacterium]|nr:polyamine aminopropyltransferase [Pseudomonadales bacterium]